ncbi:FixH family protein [Mucilaginibacter myungsuensis]|uniref:FixH family protein n=1 Tax=Mucilaginibacter myungsuensis TaxID=649104 RepID=A0A929PYN9_9SPHI|nr:FixH family protein [Mucilaginibacter myungsuensis]MBE9664476.1 FixH family protein [Mucilaginibacter myungsuensis]MDN3601379.1 FixH family protein [Mucilaginibacter myungsuensis]
MNWGRGIVGGMAVFMVFILSLCFQMFRAPADEYDHQYYEKGLGYDKDYKRERQVVIDKAQPTIEHADGQLLILFTDTVNGKARFIRPSSTALDKTVIINSGQTAAIPLGHFSKGRWTLVLEWQSHNKDYLYQKEIYIK